MRVTWFGILIPGLLPMCVCGETSAVVKLRQTGQPALEALRLGDAAQGGDVAPLEEVQLQAFAGEYIFEVQRVMDTLNDAGGRIDVQGRGYAGEARRHSRQRPSRASGASHQPWRA